LTPDDHARLQKSATSGAQTTVSCNPLEVPLNEEEAKFQRMQMQGDKMTPADNETASLAIKI